MQFLEITTPILSCPIYLIELYAHEAINKSAQYYLEIITSCLYEELITCLGMQFELVIQTKHYTRRFKGYLIQLKELNTFSNYYHYSLNLVSRMGLLDYHTDYHIYKSTTLKNIFTSVFKRHNFNDLECITQQCDTQINYCVQYNESDLQFIQRLCYEHNIIFLDHAEKTLFSDQNTLAIQEKQNLLISDLKRADYQLWHWKDRHCFSNYPLLKLGDLINDNNFIISIKHHASVRSHEYYHYLKFDPKIQIAVTQYKKIAGLQKAFIHTDTKASAAWDHHHDNTQTLTGIGLKPAIGSSALIKYKDNNPQQPYIYGALYDSKNKAPFSITEKVQHHGIKSLYDDQIRFQYYPNAETLIYTPSTLRFSHSNNYRISATQDAIFDIEKIFNSNSTTTIIQSDTEITLSCGDSIIQLTPDAIIISSNKLSFSKTGIDAQ